jgi:AraC-like DNA-binding protein
MTGAHDRGGSLRSTDLAEITDWYARHVRVRLSTPGLSSPARGLDLDHRRIGRIRVTRSRMPGGMTITTADADVYALATVDTGALHVDEAARRWTLTPSVAGLYRPPRELRSNHAFQPTGMTYIQIGRHDLERHLEALIEQYVHGPVDFSPSLPLRGNPAWLRLFRVYTDVFDDPASTVNQPIVSEPLGEAMINALLYAADHPYRSLLHQRARPARPRHIALVVDAMHAEPERAYTVASLARISGVSVRSLQQGFRDHVGMPPLAYLRRVRLTRAHDDLVRDQAVTVAEAAHRWGFTHLGRFAAAYSSVYGAAPSLTRSAVR